MNKIGLLFFVISLPAWSYNFTKDFKNGFYWKDLPLKLTIQESNSTRKKMLQDFSEQAIEEWQSRTGLAIWSLKENGGTSNLIRWSTNFGKETQMDESSVLAVAIRYTEGPYFAKTEIVINGNHPDIKRDKNNVLTTLTHELGHTVGLDHSDDWDAVMAPTLQEPYYGLANDDVEGMTDAHETTSKRQTTNFISPLASEKSESSSSPLSCGTVGAVGSSSSGLASLSIGMLMGFVRKIFNWVKSLL